MVRTVVGDDGQLEARLDSMFLPRVQAQVGLLIGKLEVAPSRDSVFALVPTPAKDGEEAAKITSVISGQGSGKKSAKVKPNADTSSLVIDTDWVAEHACQVSRMIVGGMDVVGIYVFASETTLKNSSATLWQAVRAVATASPLTSENNDRLVLQISSSPRRVACKSCALDGTFSSTGLRPCDWKLGKLLSNLRTFTCSHPVDIRLPLLVKDKKTSIETVKDNLSAAISAESARLKSAVAVVDGFVPPPGKVLGSGSTWDSPKVVEFLSRLDGSGGTGDIQGRQRVESMVTLTGIVHGRAYASTRELLQRAILDLKDDVISSLKSRLELLCDEAEQAVEEAQGSGIDESQNSAKMSNFTSPFLRPSADENTDYSVVLPRRVFVPWHCGIFLCDYLLTNETLEDVKERCVELIAVSKDLDSSQILQPEWAAVLPPITSLLDAVKQKSTFSRTGVIESGNSGKHENGLTVAKSPTEAYAIPHSKVIICALVTLLLAMILALLLLK